jgi:hypothetical protein
MPEKLAKEVAALLNLEGGHILGVPRTIVQGMLAHNGTEPDLIEEGGHFLVRLWKEPKLA